MESFAQRNPELLEEYDFSKNSIDVCSISYSSAKKAWWVCKKCQYEWIASFNNRSNGRNCPNCANRVLIVGKNDLATVKPEFLSWWDDESSPESYMSKSRKVVQWKCPYGHIFQKAIKRFNLYCSDCSQGNTNFKYDKSFGNLADENLLKEWSENNPFNFNQFSYNSTKIVEWVCQEKEHVWKSMIYARFNGSNCPDCAKNSQSSKGEQELINFVKEVCDKKEIDIEFHNRTILNGKELDIYIPDLKIAIEFNGLYWHSEQAGKDNTYHYDKWKSCYDKDIYLMTIWEDEWSNSQSLIKDHLINNLDHKKQLRIVKNKINDYKDSGFELTLDHMYDNIKAYENMGFMKIEEIKPDCFYVLNNVRINKDNLYKEIQNSNKVLKIWDAGKSKYILN